MKQVFQSITRNSFFLGLLFFSVQLFVILLICPEKTWAQSWLSLASHWDSGWYEAIAQVGYLNDHGPLHTGAYSSNVVFFPGYPYLARAIILLGGVNAKVALLLVSQGATLLFWCLLFHILRNNPWREQWYAAMLIVSFPTSWFMFMGYSESLFILAACLMLWLATQKKWVLSGISAIVMTSTRLLGIPVLIAPLLSSMVASLSDFKALFRLDLFQANLKNYKPYIWIAIVGSLGCIGFLIYCAVEFGSWNLYFDMERVGWGGTADPLFLFKLPTWLPPPFGYGLEWAPPLTNGYESLFMFKFFRMAAFSFSETLVPIFLWVFILYSILMLRKQHRFDQNSLTWYFAALLLFLLSCFSLSIRSYESMSRCLLPVWILLVMSDVIHPDKLFIFRLKQHALVKIMMPIVIVISLGFWLQLLNRYFLGWWVA